MTTPGETLCLKARHTQSHDVHMWLSESSANRQQSSLQFPTCSSLSLPHPPPPSTPTQILQAHPLLTAIGLICLLHKPDQTPQRRCTRCRHILQMERIMMPIVPPSDIPYADERFNWIAYNDFFACTGFL